MLTVLFMKGLGRVFLDQYHVRAISRCHSRCLNSWPESFNAYVKERKTAGKVLKTGRLATEMQPLYLWGKYMKAVAVAGRSTINYRLSSFLFPFQSLKAFEAFPTLMDAIL